MVTEPSTTAIPSTSPRRIVGVAPGEPAEVVAELPVDSDLDVGETPLGRPRPIHLRRRYLAIVALGGAVGTAGREALSLAIPPILGLPVGTLIINVVGAFALGALLEALARLGADEGIRRTLRLLLGTGFLGGFTTYSALATTVGQLLSAGRTPSAVAYGVATVVLGAVATLFGIVASASVHRRRTASLADAGQAR